MTNAMAIFQPGLTASAAKLSTAATGIVRAFVSRPEPSSPPPQPVPPASPATGPVAAPLTPTATVMQEGNAEAGMADLIEARAAYQADLAAMAAANALSGATLDILR